MRFAENLVRTFVRRSLWITAILCFFLTLLVPVLLYYYDLQQYLAESSDMVHRFVDTDLCFRPKDLAENPKSRDAIGEHIAAFMEFGNLLDFKLWAKDGTLVYAFRDHASMGRTFPETRELAKTLATGTTSALTDPDGGGQHPDLKQYGNVVAMYAPVKVDGKVEGAVEVYRKAPRFRPLKEHIVLVVLVAVLIFLLLYLLLSGEFKKAASELIGKERKLESAYRSIGISYIDTIRSLIKALELRDMETEGHSERVVALSVYIGEKLHLSEQELDRLILGSYLHDIGKIGVPDAVLLKPGLLDPEERVAIQTHVPKGIEIIRDIAFLSPAAEVLLNHHERWDGNGYHTGLKGEEIPITARIFSLVDALDALTSNRPYRKALSFQEARDIIKEERGKHFDPSVVDVFLQIREQEIADIKGEISAHGIHHTVNSAVAHLLEVHSEASQPIPAALPLPLATPCTRRTT